LADRKKLESISRASQLQTCCILLFGGNVCHCSLSPEECNPLEISQEVTSFGIAFFFFFEMAA
jgi:hypothetical protein